MSDLLQQRVDTAVREEWNVLVALKDNSIRHGIIEPASEDSSIYRVLGGHSGVSEFPFSEIRKIAICELIEIGV